MTVRPAATLLALGGASWPRLGSDGAWADDPARAGVPVAPLRPANCGFAARLVRRSSATRFAGAAAEADRRHASGPDRARRGGHHRGRASRAAWSTPCPRRCATRSSGTAPRRCCSTSARTSTRPRSRSRMGGPRHLARQCAAPRRPVRRRRRPGARSSAGRRRQAAAAVADRPRARSTARSRPPAASRSPPWTSVSCCARRPGVFAAGEMLDWEAPTGGYLLQACLQHRMARGRRRARLARSGAPTRREHFTRGLIRIKAPLASATHDVVCPCYRGKK